MEYRLNKYISNSGYCSRREADRFIEEGRVTINGKRATVGMRVLPKQKVRVNGELIVNDIEPIYIAFNKPVGVVSTTDPLEKDNIVNYIRHEQRIFPIGRLDKDSQGLILLTNDGDIVNKILRAGNNHKKEYLVKVNKPITKDFLTRMAQGVPILDRVTRRCEIVEINPFMFQISLIQGLNRQIRRMCEYFDYEVVKLERIQIMNIKLGNLGQGNWRDLTPSELEGLFDMLENSEKTASSKKPANSNKAFNRALEEFDIRTDYRKASIAAKYQKKEKGTPKERTEIPEAKEGGKAKPKRTGKAPSGLRVGKQKVVANRPKTKSKPKTGPKSKKKNIQ
ncbi:23S rRNA pseudouridine(2604) synthase RluF [Dysgonomonas sp. Marseille-P4677]|uniref:23S rRNA pseudouridine(2604) synthase RluF n=1 Tax=Dysgonomonas sp. Marseille-P4677 TaxID=2364790 RepID=UPI001911A141|nr:23S rRNA pseudouridine(2604) synthase RluF [Dysgonomonas sp. Marseille-P4677]MBK5721304.1 23S rRNA pseudouridine(2604) synthase RluF [Dysgonomonas sp. Marseille-P4677]